jgi:RND family efflux transporter MFP subunit
MKRSIAVSVPVLVAAVLGAAGCARNEAAQVAVAQQAPRVTVAQVIEQSITDFDEFTGRFVAVERVALRPRVSGYISSVSFAAGREIKKDDVLFTIDPRPYQAELEGAKAELARARAQLELSKSERQRAVKLMAQHAISREEFDSRVSQSEQGEASVRAAAAAVDAAALNLSFTQVRSPIDGLVSHEEVTAGNLVTAGQTLLTTIVSVDKLFVEFEGDEQVYLKYAALARKGELTNAREATSPVWVGLADETDTPHEGRMVFIDNALDPQTGTIRARALLDNKDRRFTPGLFARVKLTGSAQYDALLVNDSAIGTDQGSRYVFSLDKDNKVQYRPVKLGTLANGLRVVLEGLAEGDYVVVNGLQRVRPGVQVAPERVVMGQQASNGLLAANTQSPR